MFNLAHQPLLQPHVGRVPAHELTSSIKRSVLAMSMRFSYDARVCRAASSKRFTHPVRTRTCKAATPANSVQEFRQTRDTADDA
ncbi:hypothetical protein DW355_02470 [Hylemonella gracilis]|uniref:Uncharacterized protein n=1 Tax=Hylemonella gracilis TaxID=80880 RepID=A0A4P6UH69_9BURK|nr:hypothetical protein DW355_02470 [Hylemonella gracilis]